MAGSRGWAKKAKGSMLREEAARAREEGHTVFVPMLNTGFWERTSAMYSAPVSGWAEMIESIEGEGWRLEQWSVATDTKGRPQAYPLFRRGAW